jgi:hypothetical protein
MIKFEQKKTGEVRARSRGKLQRKQKTIVCSHEKQDKTKIRD